MYNNANTFYSESVDFVNKNDSNGKIVINLFTIINDVLQTLLLLVVTVSIRKGSCGSR